MPLFWFTLEAGYRVMHGRTILFYLPQAKWETVSLFPANSLKFTAFPSAAFRAQGSEAE